MLQTVELESKDAFYTINRCGSILRPLLLLRCTDSSFSITWQFRRVVNSRTIFQFVHLAFYALIKWNYKNAKIAN